MDESIYTGVNYLVKADWLNLPPIVLGPGLNLFVNVYIKPGLHFPILGIPDSYSDESCLTSLGNFSRIFKDNGAYTVDSMAKRLQKHLQYTKNFQTLADLQAAKFPIGAKNKVNNLLKEINCVWAKAYIPVKWKGSDHSCGPDMIIKGINVDNKTGEIIEDCSGVNLNVQTEYYIEILIKGSEEPQGYDKPLQWEIDAAASNGYILYDIESEEFSSSDQSKTVKFRFWVRPETRVSA